LSILPLFISPISIRPDGLLKDVTGFLIGFSIFTLFTFFLASVVPFSFFQQ